MRAFAINAGTPCHVIREGAEWTADNFLSHEFEKNAMFFREDIVVDPVGKIGCHRGLPSTIGGLYAINGFYGFKRSGWIVIVHVSEVQVL